MGILKNICGEYFGVKLVQSEMYFGCILYRKSTGSIRPMSYIFTHELDNLKEILDRLQEIYVGYTISVEPIILPREFGNEAIAMGICIMKKYDGLSSQLPKVKFGCQRESFDSRWYL